MKKIQKLKQKRNVLDTHLAHSIYSYLIGGLATIGIMFVSVVVLAAFLGFSFGDTFTKIMFDDGIIFIVMIVVFILIVLWVMSNKIAYVSREEKTSVEKKPVRETIKLSRQEKKKIKLQEKISKLEHPEEYKEKAKKVVDSVKTSTATQIQQQQEQFRKEIKPVIKNPQEKYLEEMRKKNN